MQFLLGIVLVLKCALAIPFNSSSTDHHVGSSSEPSIVQGQAAATLLAAESITPTTTTLQGVATSSLPTLDAVDHSSSASSVSTEYFSIVDTSTSRSSKKSTLFKVDPNIDNPKIPIDFDHPQVQQFLDMACQKMDSAALELQIIEAIQQRNPHMLHKILECPICYELLSSNSLATTQCGHMLHNRCYNFNPDKKLCAVCRQRMGESVDLSRQTLIRKALELFEEQGWIDGTPGYDMLTDIGRSQMDFDNYMLERLLAHFKMFKFSALRAINMIFDPQGHNTLSRAMKDTLNFVTFGLSDMSFENVRHPPERETCVDSTIHIPNESRPWVVNNLPMVGQFFSNQDPSTFSLLRQIQIRLFGGYLTVGDRRLSTHELLDSYSRYYKRRKDGAFPTWNIERKREMMARFQIGVETLLMDLVSANENGEGTVITEVPSFIRVAIQDSHLNDYDTLSSWMESALDQIFDSLVHQVYYNMAIYTVSREWSARIKMMTLIIDTLCSMAPPQAGGLERLQTNYNTHAQIVMTFLDQGLGGFYDLMQHQLVIKFMSYEKEASELSEMDECCS